MPDDPKFTEAPTKDPDRAAPSITTRVTRPVLGAVAVAAAIWLWVRRRH